MLIIQNLQNQTYQLHEYLDFWIMILPSIKSRYQRLCVKRINQMALQKSIDIFTGHGGQKSNTEKHWRSEGHIWSKNKLQRIQRRPRRPLYPKMDSIRNHNEPNTLKEMIAKWNSDGILIECFLNKIIRYLLYS